MKQLATVLAIKCGHFNALDRLETKSMDDEREIKRLQDEIRAIAKEHLAPETIVNILMSGLEGLLMKTTTLDAEYSTVVRPTFVGPETEVSIVTKRPTFIFARSIETVSSLKAAMTRMIEG